MEDPRSPDKLWDYSLNMVVQVYRTTDTYISSSSFDFYAHDLCTKYEKKIVFSLKSWKSREVLLYPA